MGPNLCSHLTTWDGVRGKWKPLQKAPWSARKKSYSFVSLHITGAMIGCQNVLTLLWLKTHGWCDNEEYMREGSVQRPSPSLWLHGVVEVLGPLAQPGLAPSWGALGLCPSLRAPPALAIHEQLWLCACTKIYFFIYSFSSTDNKWGKGGSQEGKHTMPAPGSSTRDPTPLLATS